VVLPSSVRPGENRRSKGGRTQPTSKEREEKIIRKKIYVAPEGSCSPELLQAIESKKSAELFPRGGEKGGFLLKG